ncbi:MAG: preprotein translocase subunit YajC [Rhodospirillales bacterium]|nr:preprotein translocase subunit YajC [Rhodospirillales bacterium]QQS11947.1 MAG: preprotein translocase subunit YajC [Rhodospirillales bacterium]
MFISEAHAQTGGGGGLGGLEQILPLILIFGVFYFLLIRPQQKKMREQRELIASVKRGDRVVTQGGIIGLVTRVIGEQELQVEIAEGVRVRIIKSTVASILARNESVRGAKDDDADVKPMIETKPSDAPVARGGLLGGLFGRKKD